MFINEGEKDKMVIAGFRVDRVRAAVTLTVTILTLGLPFLIYVFCKRRRDLTIRCFCVETESLGAAEYVLLKDQYNRFYFEKIILVSDEDSIKTDVNNPLERKQDDKKSRDLLLTNLNKIYEQCEEGQNHIELKSPLLRVHCTKYFTNRDLKYVFNEDSQSFEKLRGLTNQVPCSYFHRTRGISTKDQVIRLKIYGKNVIEVHVTPIWKLFYTQAYHPLYLFLLFSVCLWYTEYPYYATCILVISVISLADEIYQIRVAKRKIKTKTANVPTEEVNALRNNKFEMVPSDSLVPGDVIEIPRNGFTMQCDAVLVNGNCIVSESMLTGESMPITKTPIPDPNHSSTSDCDDEIMFNVEEHSRHILFCGTRVIQGRYYVGHPVKAVVISTGFSTAKGELVRSILHPKPVTFRFKQEAFKFFGVLGILALAGMIYTIKLKVDRNDDLSSIVIRSLDLVTIVIPPALPAAMTIGIIFAQKRLKLSKIFCISPNNINVCGAINAFCFDKTGTLTEEGMDIGCVVPVHNQQFQREERDVASLYQRSDLVVAMATCHSLTLIDDVIAGDPLDAKMFEATDWILEETGEDAAKFDSFAPTVVRPKIRERPGAINAGDNISFQIGILRQFTFSSTLQRMSVITRRLGSDHFDIYAKGSPEMIASLCNQQTVPSNFQETLMHYTQQGYRVLALAHRPLARMNYVKIQRTHRSRVENDLTLLGLLVMENRLKPETAPVIRELKGANIRTIMVTGDNILTAISVARECGIIEPNNKLIMLTALPPSESNGHSRLEYACAENCKSFQDGIRAGCYEPAERFQFVVTGKSWSVMRKHFKNVMPKLAVRGAIFARFLPEQKQQLVELLQEVGYYVGMCGDGANDCGALKTAHAGISLSDAESSVASPFTSQDPTIECVPTVIKEGRAAMVTTSGIFRFMAGYSMTQFLSVCLLYWVGSNLTDFTFLYIDILLLTLGISFCYTGACPKLDWNPPTVSLLTVTPILSIIGQLLVNLAAQVFTWLSTTNQPWFQPCIPDNDQCHEVTVVFYISSFQFITMSIVFSKGMPYRKSIFSNGLFMANIFVGTLLTLFLVLHQPHWMPWLAEIFELDVPPSFTYRAYVCGLAGINFFLAFFVETYLIDPLDRRFFRNLTDRCLNATLKHVAIESELGRHIPHPESSTFVELMKIENQATGDDGEKIREELQRSGENSDESDTNDSMEEDEEFGMESHHRLLQPGSCN